MRVFESRIAAVAIIAAIIAFSMIHPVIRRIIWIILPMGRGWDDVVFWIALAVIAVYFWTNFQPSGAKKRNQKNGTW